MFSVLCIGTLFLLSSCAPVVVGTAAVGAYKGATDERSTGTMVDDSIISTKIKTGLISEEQVKARHIDVDVIDGVVYLIGVIESNTQKRLAEQIASQVDGVKRVENQLVIGKTSPGQALDDMMLASRIKTELFKRKEIKILNIDVDVHNYVVTVSGITQTAEEKEIILTIARQKAGTSNVVDNLTVKN